MVTRNIDSLLELFTKVKVALPTLTRRKFLGWAFGYIEPERTNGDDETFHGPSHPVELARNTMETIREIFGQEMYDYLTSERFTDKDREDIFAYASLIAFVHDRDYPGIKNGKVRLIDEPELVTKNITGSGENLYLKKQENPDDIHDYRVRLATDLTNLLKTVFYGHEHVGENNKINPLSGMNEAFSALAAIEFIMENAGVVDVLKNLKTGEWEEKYRLVIDEKDLYRLVLIAVTGTAHTVPFEGQGHIDKLFTNMDKANEEFGVGLDDKELDKFRIASQLIAYKDLISFMGKLNPFDPQAKATVESVLNTVTDSQGLNPEENQELRGKSNGDVKPVELLKALLKRQGLYKFKLPGEKGKIPNLFGVATLKDGTKFPPQKVADRYSELAGPNNFAAAISADAKLIGTAIVTALADKNPKWSNLKLIELLGPQGLNPVIDEDEVIRNFNSKKPNELMQLGFGVLSRPPERTAVYDSRRSTTAQLVMDVVAGADNPIEKLREVADVTREFMNYNGDLAKCKPDVYREKLKELGFGNLLTKVERKIGESMKKRAEELQNLSGEVDVVGPHTRASGTRSSRSVRRDE